MNTMLFLSSTSAITTAVAKQTEHVMRLAKFVFVVLMVIVTLGLFNSGAHAQTIIAKQSFESTEAAPTWNYSGTINRVSWLSFGLSTADMSSDGDFSWDVTNTTQTITLANQSTLGYKNVSFVFDLAAGDKLSPYNGYPDSDDSIFVDVSTNAGSTWSREVVMIGPNSGYFGYYQATATYDGNNVPTVISGQHGGLALSLPDGTHQYAVRMTGKTNSSHDSWWIDYPRLVGTPVDPNGMKVTAINGGVVPSAGEPFSITVQAINLANIIVPVVQNTGIHIALQTGTGALSGTVNGQIDSGSSSVTISGLLYSKAESGVSLTVSRTSGDVLSSATSNTFTVNSGAQTFTFPDLVSSGIKGVALPNFTVEAHRPDNSLDTNYDGYTVTLSKATGPGTLSGTLTANTLKGVASFSGIAIDSEGTYTFHASGSLVSTATSSSVLIAKVIPTIDSSYADSIGPVYAKTHAFVNLKGGVFSSYVEYGTTPSYGTATSPQTVSGSGYCLNLSAASSQYAELDHNDMLLFDESSHYTIEAWVKFSSFTWLGGIVGKYQNGGSNGFDVRLLGDGDYRGIDFDGMTTADDILNAGQWYHIAAVNDGGTRHLYIDGVEQILSGSSWGVQQSYDVVSIGAD